jgi:hypothetical protein
MHLDGDHPCPVWFAVLHAGAIYGGSQREVLFRCALLSKAALEAPWHVACGGATYGKAVILTLAAQCLYHLVVAAVATNKGWAGVDAKACLVDACLPCPRLLVSRAVNAWLPHAGDSNLLFIANDWHTALLPVYLQVKLSALSKHIWSILPLLAVCPSAAL